MLGAFEQNATSKGLHQYTQNWELLRREDIYRQRVLGNDCGKKDFIDLDDQRKQSVLQLFIYIIFLIFAINFVQARINFGDAHAVNAAIAESLFNTPYQLSPDKKTWDDISTMDDVKKWLSVSFPAFVTPAVQVFNKPIGSMRFTLRRILQKLSADTRFGPAMPSVWKDVRGIYPSQSSTTTDDTKSFGAYRQWKDPSQEVVLEWVPAEPHKKCTGQIIDVLELARNMTLTAATPVAVEVECKRWCEQLQDPLPCRCFTVSNYYRCEFRYVPESHLQNVAVMANWNKEPGIVENQLIPRGQQESGSKMYYPLIKNFKFDAGETGFQGTSGFVEYQMPYSEKIGSPTLASAWAPTHVIANQIKDWIQGGMLRSGAAAFVVDFVTYNENYQAFTWLSMEFTVDSSGIIIKRQSVNTLLIPLETIKNKIALLFKADYVYVAMLVCYLLWELKELIQSGTVYFKLGWNWFTLVVLGLQCASIYMWLVYIDGAVFSEYLSKRFDEVSDKGSVSTLDNKKTVHSFQMQFTAYRSFVRVGSISTLFLCFKLVHYMNDTNPRVRVLMDAIHRALTPGVFTIVISACGLVGFMFCAMLMFGEQVEGFSTFPDAFSSCIQLLFGEIDQFKVMKETFPVNAMIFFIVYMLLFYFILQQLSTAVVIKAYEDACKSYQDTREKEESRKRATATDTGGEFLTRVMRRIRLNLMKAVADSRGDRGSEGDQGSMNPYAGNPHKFSISSIVAYGFYIVIYFSMAYMMTQINMSNRLTETVYDAVRSPAFGVVSPVTNEENLDNNFDSVATPSDVNDYLLYALPQTMFNTSTGTFDGQPNPLKQYASALPSAVYEQLVINNWNIVVGQKPMRITTRYFKTAVVEQDEAMPGILDFGTRIHKRGAPGELPARVNRGVADVTFLEEKDAANLDGESTREVVAKHCPYATGYWASSRNEKNGFVCMLSVNATETYEILRELAANNFVTEQTAMVVIDFVIYNSYSEAFAYVAITFDFDQSGSIFKHIEVSTVRLHLFTSVLNFSRFGLEILVFLFNLAYLGTSMYLFLKCIANELRISQDRRRQHEGGEKRISVVKKVFIVFRAELLFFLKHPFVCLDIVSSCLTVATFVLWYLCVLGNFRMQYFFQQYPTWDQGICDSEGFEWCSDEEVLFEFAAIVARLRLFRQVLAFNCIFVCFRTLKYLQRFERVRVLFNTFYRGFEDIVWFFVVMFTILSGYVLLAYMVFQPNVYGLSTYAKAIPFNFAMFLGRFDYVQLREADSVMSGIYFFSYMIICRYFLINMFLAIIDKNFREEEEERSKAAQERKQWAEEARRNPTKDSPDVRAPGLVGFLRSMVTPRRETERPSSPMGTLVSADDAPRNVRNGSGLTEAQRAARAAQGARLDNSQRSARVLETASFAEDMVPESTNWRFLPEEAKTWALETAKSIARFCDDHVQKKEEIQRVNLDVAAELEKCLTEAESEIKKRRNDRQSEAMKVRTELEQEQLRTLKEVHQDQESLAWYIMKREAELTKLEKAKELKQDRIDKMFMAMKSLINADEEGADDADGRRAALAAQLADE